MKIAVWCASEFGDDPIYAECARALGEAIARGGHTLVYGGSNCGLMGAVADAVLAAGGEVDGVTVDIPKIIAQRHPGLTRCIVMPDMATRKRTMMDMADAFVALPGGVGTLDEVGDVMALLRSGVSTKRLALYSVNGFYAHLQEFFETMLSAKFVVPENFSRVLVSGDLAEIMAFVEGSK